MSIDVNTDANNEINIDVDVPGSLAANVGTEVLLGPKGDTGEQGPQGEDGADGEAATIEIGTVTTVGYDQPATVTNVGTDEEAIFNFEIPRGVPGSSAGIEAGAAIDVTGDVVSVKYDNNTLKVNSSNQLYAANTGNVDDVKVNGTSVVTNKVANIPIASTADYGVVKLNSAYGLSQTSAQVLKIEKASEQGIINQSNAYTPIVPANLRIAIREGLGNNSITWTDAYKTSARNTIGAQETLTSGTNIKTVNSQSILGSGNIEIQAGASELSQLDDVQLTSLQDNSIIAYNSTSQKWENNQLSQLDGSLGMPSDRYVDLELGASGSEYTAPANGWFKINKKANGNNQNVSLSSNQVQWTAYAPASTYNVAVSMPVLKGQSVKCSYTAAGELSSFRFIYAEGDKNA